MTRRAALALAVFLLCGAAYVLVPHALSSATAHAQLPGRGDSVDHGGIVCVEVHYADGYTEDLPAGCAVVQATPSATPTPTASATPAPTITDTPPPWPTFTPTNTPGFSPTPTQEITPQPTPSETAIPKDCTLKATTAMRIRTGPGTEYSYTGVLWDQGAEKTFTAFQESADGAYLFGRHDQGWSAVLWLTAPDTEPNYGWFVVGTNTSDACRDVPGWPELIAPPEPIARAPAAWLIHTVPGVNRAELYSSYPILAQAGIMFGVKAYADMETCLNTLDAGGECIYRWPVSGDCPAQIGTADPTASAWDWMTRYEPVIAPLKAYAATGRVWAELINECLMGDEGNTAPVYWWATWLDTAADYALAHDWPPVIPVTYGPGDGDSAFAYNAWKPALLKFASEGGLMGFHAYSINEQGGLCGCDPWLACRHRMNYIAMQAAGLNMGYAITEAARGWGGSPVDEADFVCFYDKVKNDPGLQSVAAWIGGYHVAWSSANLDGHYVSLAQSIAR